MFFTLYAVSTLGEFLAFLLKYPNNPKGSVFLYVELL